VCFRFDDLRTTAEILRFAQDDKLLTFPLLSEGAESWNLVWTDSACAIRPSAPASVTIDGRRRDRPLRVIFWTKMHLRKSAALKPPRTCAAPAVGRM